jgi:hypothetical protein
MPKLKLGNQEVPKEFTKENLYETVAGLAARVKELQDHAENTGTEISKDDLATIKAAVDGLAGDIGNMKPQVEAITRTASKGDVDGLGVLRCDQKAPEGLSQLHFNLLTKTPHELSHHGAVLAEAGIKNGLEDVGMSKRWQSKLREFQALSDQLYILDVMLSARDPEYAERSESRTKRIQSLKSYKDYDRLVKEFKAAAGTALDTATADQGLEWVPTMFSSQLREQIQAQDVVGSLFDTIPMPSGTYVNPVMGADMIAYKQPEALEETGTDKPLAKTFITQKMTLVAKKLGARILSSNEFTEDSIVPVVPRIIAQIGKALARGRATAIINGDTTATHMDYDTTGTTDARKTWKGLRYYALNGPSAAAVDGGGAALVFRTSIGAMRKGMKVYGIPGRTVLICGFSSYVELMLAKDDNNNNLLLTVDKYGPGAAVIPGEVGRVLGMPVLISEFMREDLASTGVNTMAGPNTRGAIIAVHRDGYVLGERRAATITRLNELYAETDQIGFVGFWRGDFQPVYPTATEPAVGIIRNVLA